MAPGIRRAGQHPAGIEMVIEHRLRTSIAAAALLIATGAFADPGHAQAVTSNDQTASRSGTQLIMPIMNSARGRELFASKGCVTCHSINGVGGEDAPALDAHTMKPYMNPFEFAAKMWRGAATMIALQEEGVGAQIEFTGEELGDIIAFVHDEVEQHKFSEADIPPEIMSMMDHVHGDPSGAVAHAEELGHGTEEGADDHNNEGAEAHTD